MKRIGRVKITIAVTCFNAETTIGRAIASARAVDWPDLEILVCDDGSGDGSGEVIAAHAQEDPRVRFIRNEANRGLPATRNRLVVEAAGEVVAFLDDDDECLPERLRRQIARLEQAERMGEGPVACYGAYQRIAPGARQLKHSIGRQAPVGGREVALHLLCKLPLAGTGRVCGCTLMARRSTFIALPFDAGFRRTEDREWAVRFALAGGRFVSCPEPVLIKHPTGGPDKSNALMWSHRARMVRKHRDFLRAEHAYLCALIVHRPPFFRRRGFSRLSKLLVGLLMFMRRRRT